MIDEMIVIEDKQDTGEVTLYRDGTLGAYIEVHGSNGCIELDKTQTRELYDSMTEYYNNLDFYHRDT